MRCIRHLVQGTYFKSCPLSPLINWLRVPYVRSARFVSGVSQEWYFGEGDVVTNRGKLYTYGRNRTDSYRLQLWSPKSTVRCSSLSLSITPIFAIISSRSTTEKHSLLPHSTVRQPDRKETFTQTRSKRDVDFLNNDQMGSKAHPIWGGRPQRVFNGPNACRLARPWPVIAHTDRA